MTSRKTVAVFMGTRPEAIKMAPVVAGLAATADLECRVVATGQHREMFQQVAEQFGFGVDVDLAVMRPHQTLAGLTARLMEKIDGWLEGGHPDMALVQGDTTTVLVAALACFYRRIPIGHVEAGLRTGNIWSPFPEEVNRRLASPIVSLHFAPTESAKSALLKEGVPEARIEVTGNTVIDALFMELAQQGKPAIRAEVDASLSSLLGPDWATNPLRADHRPPAGELRRRHPADLRGHPGARSPLSGSPLRVPRASQSERPGARESSCSAACRTCA